jgi:hypothetical protein
LSSGSVTSSPNTSRLFARDRGNIDLLLAASAIENGAVLVTMTVVCSMARFLDLESASDLRSFESLPAKTSGNADVSPNPVTRSGFNSLIFNDST